MKPDYITADGRIQLYLGDCLDVLPTLPDGHVDMIIADPPYIGLKGGLKGSSQRLGVAPIATKNVTVGELRGNDISILAKFQHIAKGALVFSSWHRISTVQKLLGGTSVGLITWYKRNSQPSMRNRPWYQTEFIWAIEYSPYLNWKVLHTLYDILGLPAGCMASERILSNGSKQAAHPTQKPLELMYYLLEACNNNDVVLDPFMGTGTVGVACIKTGKRFIGIEIDPVYFQMTVDRIEAALAQPTLFDSAEIQEPVIQPVLIG